MTTTISLLDSINGEAASFRKAQARYDKAFRAFRASVTPLSPEHFWPMADAFRLTFLRTMHYRKEKVADSAADEFLRQAVVGQSSYDLAAAVHFALSYGHYKRLAHTGGDKCHFSFDRGDDGYGDLMDAVVLLGREFNELLHAGRFHDLADFNTAVMDRCQGSVTVRDFPYQYADDPVGDRVSLASRLCVLVLRGENYCAMSLEDAAQKWVSIEAGRNTPEDSE